MGRQISRLLRFIQCEAQREQRRLLLDSKSEQPTRKRREGMASHQTWAAATVQWWKVGISSGFCLVDGMLVAQEAHDRNGSLSEWDIWDFGGVEGEKPRIMESMYPTSCRKARR